MKDKALLYQLAIEFTLDEASVRLAAPGESSIRREHGSWRRLEADRLRRLLADGRERHYAVLLCPRDDLASPCPRVLDTGTGTAGQASARVGWPTPVPSSAATVQQVIDHRSNDYGDIDRARELIGDSLSAEDTVSVVIPARNSQESIDAVIASIAAAASGITWECIVVDDASDRPLTLSRQHEQVRLVRTPRRLFSAGARNLGLDQARYDTVLFCDSDTLVPDDYFARHLPLHRVSPYLITMSMRDEGDERVSTVFEPDWVGLEQVHRPIRVGTLRETDNWRTFGMGRRVGPVALQFVVWTHNLCVSRQAARAVRFPSEFVGWGLEDNAFGAAAIVYGCFIRPVMETSVRHLSHAPRSGDAQRQDQEFRANLTRYLDGLRGPVGAPWVGPQPR
jgi:GT2 family glycosyltransferase